MNLQTAKRKKRSGQVAPFYPPPATNWVPHWEIGVYSAQHEPTRWADHKQAATQSYIKRGLQTVSHDQQASGEKAPTFFSEATCVGEPVGGIRMHLPDSSGRLPIQDEIEAYVDSARLEQFIEALQPEGIVHCGGLWIDPNQKGTGVAGDLSRAYMPMILAAKACYYIATSHQYILQAWMSLRFQPVPLFSEFPYPDERYRTCVILGDVTQWPEDLTSWAQEQAKEAELEEKGKRFSVNPMRRQQLHQPETHPLKI
ncbi:MAG: hypothetical protein AAF614_44145 [Chloroflexota bacterium]